MRNSAHKKKPGPVSKLGTERPILPPITKVHNWRSMEKKKQVYSERKLLKEGEVVMYKREGIECEPGWRAVYDRDVVKHF